MPYFKLFSRLVIIFCLLLCSAAIVAKEKPSLVTSIDTMDVVYTDDNSIVVNVGYTYNGEYGNNVVVFASAVRDFNDLHYFTSMQPVTIGKGVVQLKIDRLNIHPDEIKTKYIEVKLDTRYSASDDRPIKTRFYKYEKSWPKIEVAKHETVKAYHNKLLSNAIQMIDESKKGDDLLADAAVNLQRILKEDPHNTEAYIQLARIRAKTDKNGEGFNQATKLLNIALSYDKNNAHAYEMLGNIYILQNKLDEAITVLEKANSIGTNNMWLFYNWGQAYQLKGNIKKAIDIYNQGLQRPLIKYLSDSSLRSYNRAIPKIFNNLIYLLNKTHDYSSLDKVYQKKIYIFENDNPCISINYAKFLLTKLGETDKALKNAEIAGKNNCGGPYFNVIMASIYLKKWYSAEGSNKSQERKSFYNQAQTYIEDMPKMIEDLASSTHTKDVIKGLVIQGISINTQNNKGITALTYAVINDNYDATRALLDLGADPNNIVGDRKWSTLMISVAKGNPKIIKILLQHGAKTDHKSINGITAAQIAKMQGNEQIIKLLDTFNSSSHT